MEPDDKYGYASINSFSKAIFNLPYIQINNFDYKYKIAILAYIYKEDSINEIIDKIYNIPCSFDLFIYYDYKININISYYYIIFNQNKNNFDFKLFLNKRKSLLANLHEFKSRSKNYKLICNINFDEYKNISYFLDWKNYLHNNLLGNSMIISEIITDFDKNDKLGLIFPERYYKSLIHFTDNFNDSDIKYMDFILKKILHINLNIHIIQEFFDFPEGNMFWARISAIYPIFDLYANAANTKYFKLIIENSLDKIWVYLAKCKGFIYKKIYKHY